MNRLKLNFQLEYSDERADFLANYLTQEQFIKYPPTQEELDTMGDYVLWGKNRATGLNAKQEKSVPLASRNRHWDSDQKCESLDELMESPTFNETTLSPLDAVPTRAKRQVFSRDEALKNCPEYLVDEYKLLFRSIDSLELKINYYEIQHGRRLKDPRPELLRKFTLDEQQSFQEEVTHWNQFTYLKSRHRLIDMRQSQYTLKDSYAACVIPNLGTENCIIVEPEIDFDAGIEVLPLGAWQDSYIGGLVFQDWKYLTPSGYNDTELRDVSKLYWDKQAYQPNAQQLWIDFREVEHVYEILQNWDELVKSSKSEENYTKCILRALEFYIDAADLSDSQKDILDMKLKHKGNIEIANTVNKKYGKAYTVNYISTIFRQRIIPKINAAAKYHEAVIANLAFPEEFKTCTCCHRTLLKVEENFTHKARSKDGFTTRCKQCEKAARNGGKNEKCE